MEYVANGGIKMSFVNFEQRWVPGHLQMQRRRNLVSFIKFMFVDVQGDFMRI